MNLTAAISDLAERAKAGLSRPSLFYKYHEWSDSPCIMQFNQPDTLIPDIYNPQSWNRYTYVLNNPIRYNDPTGHMASDDKDGGLTANGFQYVIEKRYNWKLKDKFSFVELKTIYKTAHDIEDYANEMTGGNGLDWMQYALGNTTLTHGKNTDSYSETLLILGENFGSQISLGQGWLNSTSWTPEEILSHELGHVWDIHSGLTYSGEMNRNLGGSSWCFFCAPGDVPQWDQFYHQTNGDAYGNSRRNDYFAEAFSATIYNPSIVPTGASEWIQLQMLQDVLRYLFPGGLQ